MCFATLHSENLQSLTAALPYFYRHVNSKITRVHFMADFSGCCRQVLNSELYTFTLPHTGTGFWAIKAVFFLPFFCQNKLALL